MRKIKFTRSSSVDEHVKLGVDLINALKALEELEEEKKQQAKEYASMIQGRKDYVKVLRSNLEEHNITLEIECRVQKNYQRGQWVFFDPETGEEVYCEEFGQLDWQTSIVEDDVEVVEAKVISAGAKILQIGSGKSDEFQSAEVV